MSVRAVESTRPRASAPVNDGATSAASVAMIAITRRSSINVKPRRRIGLLLVRHGPVADVVIAALARVRPAAQDVVALRVVDAGSLVDVGIPPGVVRDLLLEVALPLRQLRR